MYIRVIRGANDESDLSFEKFAISEGARAFLAYLLEIMSKQVQTGY